MSWFRMILTIAGKDLLIEFRTRQRLATMAAFAVMVAILFNFSIDHSIVQIQDIAAGLIWMTLIFTGLLGVGRTFQIESEDEAFQGLLLAPVPRDAVFLGKVLSNFLIVGVIVVFLMAVFGFFFQLDYGAHPFALAITMAWGTLGFVALATLFGAVTSVSQLGESLLPLLLFPILTPMIIFGASATHRLLIGRPVAEVAPNIRILAAFALIAVFSGAALFRFVVED